MATLDVNGTELEYFEQGTGTPVVLVHGSASDHRTWISQLTDLSAHYRTIAYSRRYHWPNRPISAGADYAMAEQADDLQALLPQLAREPAHLVAHSYGAFVALLVALKCPELVRTLVLEEPPVITLFASTPPKPREILRLLVTRPRIAASIIKFGATGMGPATAAARRGDMDTALRIFGTAVLGAEFYHRLSAARLEQIRANAIAAEFLGSGMAALDEQDLRGLQTPTLLLTGQLSPRLFHHLTDRLLQLLPQARRVEIAGASHMVHQANPDAYNAAVLSFLAHHRSG